MTDSCLFCRIVAGEIPAQRVAESDHALAFRDVSPQAPTHILVIPRAHIASLAAGADAEVVADMVALAQRVASEAGIAESGYRLVINTNPDGGQTVYHLHAHILGGRKMHWPPG